MRAMFMRLGLLTLACCVASPVDAQNYAPSRYGSEAIGLSQGAAMYPGAPTWDAQEPQITYPTTVANNSSLPTNQWQPSRVPNSVPTTVPPSRPPVTSQNFAQPAQPPQARPQSPYFTYQPAYSAPPIYGQMLPQFSQVTAQQPTFQPQMAQQYASVGGGVAPAESAPQHSPPPVESFPTQDGQYYSGSSSEGGFVGCGDFGCNGPGRRWFVRYDYMHWTISPPKSSLIGSTQLEGDYTRGGVTRHIENSLDTSFVDWEWQGANRVEFGARDCNTGWFVGLSHGSQTQSLTASSVNFLPADPGFPNLANSYLAGFSDGNGDGFDDDLNGNNLFGRNGEDIGTPNGTGVFVAPFDGTPDVPAPTDTGDLQIYLPVFTEATVRNTVSLTNLEIMYTTKVHGRPASDFELLYGFRFLYLEDYFGFSGTGGTLDATSFSVNSENQLLGLQLGARWTKDFGPLFLSAEGRFLASANLQDNKMFGSVGTNTLTNSNGQNGPIALQPQAFNYTTSNNEWAPLGEYRLHAILPINGCMAFRFGYTGFVAGGISRASQKVDYVLPRFGLNQSGSNETVVYNSFDFGFELTR